MAKMCPTLKLTVLCIRITYLTLEISILQVSRLQSQNIETSFCPYSLFSPMPVSSLGIPNSDATRDRLNLSVALR